MIISLVVAATENNVIGKDNRLLWHLPRDMKYFKNLTWAMPVVMGRKTFESIGSKPLKGRKNIIITRQKDWNAEGVFVVPHPQAAFSLAGQMNYKELFIIGGGEIYKQTIDLADRIFMTRVHTDVNGDTYFPEFNKNDWNLVKDTHNPADEKHAFEYSFRLWERNPNISIY